jgi:aspartyl-tRNA(Asn)/glutamyl-tRNA(Gln) amidotransferase subunit C
MAPSVVIQSTNFEREHALPLDRDAVAHVAALAHIDLSAEELEEFSFELSSVVDHIARLQELDTSSIPPTAHAVPLDNVLREDVVERSWPTEAVLANAPQRVGDLFEVQAILD